MAAIVGLSAVSTALLAYTVYFRVLAAAGATNLLLVTFLIPLSASGLGITLLGEQPRWSAFGGMALIIADLTVIDARLTKLKIQ